MYLIGLTYQHLGPHDVLAVSVIDHTGVGGFDRQRKSQVQAYCYVIKFCHWTGTTVQHLPDGTPCLPCIPCQQWAREGLYVTHWPVWLHKQASDNWRCGLCWLQKDNGSLMPNIGFTQSSTVRQARPC